MSLSFEDFFPVILRVCGNKGLFKIKIREGLDPASGLSPRKQGCAMTRKRGNFVIQGYAQIACGDITRGRILEIVVFYEDKERRICTIWIAPFLCSLLSSE